MASHFISLRQIDLDILGQSTLANILHLKWIQSNFDTEGVRIICVAVNPGPVRTQDAEGSIDSISLIPTFVKCVLSFRPWRKGGIGVTFAAGGWDVAEKREDYKGSYSTPVGVISKPSKYASYTRLADELALTT